MQAALTVEGALPPPAPGSDVLAGLHRPGAGSAANRGIALPVQDIDGNAVLLHIGVDVRLLPVNQGVELDEAVPCVPLDSLILRSGDRLAAPQAADPDVKTGERASLGSSQASAAAPLRP